MADSNHIIGLVERIDPAPIASADHHSIGFEGATLQAVRFHGNEPVYLDPRQPGVSRWRSLLDTLQFAAEPAYVEYRAGDRVISKVLMPSIGRITSLTFRATGDIEVRLDVSPGTQVLKGEAPSAMAWRDALERAAREKQPIVITTDPADPSLFDLQPYAEPVAPPCAALEPEDVVIAQVSVVTMQEAKAIFDAISSAPCKFPFDPHDSCLPLTYTNGYCYAVAHKVHQAFAAKGLVVGKAWVFDPLNFSTENSPTCSQHWDFHVASFVRTSNTFDRGEFVVIDPVVNRGPMLLAKWLAKIGAPKAIPKITAPRIYLHTSTSAMCEHQGDPEPSLRKMREMLLSLIESEGEPPYDFCRVV